MIREAFRKTLLTPETAAAIAIEALGNLAADPEKLSGFLALAGIGPDSLRRAAQEAGFLHALLDYICADEALLHELAAAARRTPEEIDRARQVLAGPEPDWSA